MRKNDLAPILALSCLIMAIWSKGKTILGMITKIVYTAAALTFILSFLMELGVIKPKAGGRTDE